MSKTIWLTGSRGFVGRALAVVLEQTGAALRRCTNQPSSPAGGSPDSNACVQLDYFDPADIEAKVHSIGVPDVFIHSGWGAMDQPESAVHLGENVRAGQTLIRTLFTQGLKTFLFIGSMNEYGARTGALSEDLEPEGRLTNYAKAKREVAAFGFQAAQTFGRTFVHARTFYVYGAGQRSGSLINDLYQAARAGTEANLSPCEHYRDYIHVSEVAEGLRRLCDLEHSTTVNLGSGRVVQVKDLVLLLWKTLGGDPDKLKFGARQVRWDEPEQPRSYADLTRLRSLLHWAPSLSLEEGINLTVRDLRAAG